MIQSGRPDKAPRHPARADLMHVIAGIAHRAQPLDYSEENTMMNWNDMGTGMGFGWLFGLLILVLVVLAIAALIKYLRT